MICARSVTQQMIVMSVLKMLMRWFSDWRSKLEMVLAEGAKTAIKKCSICSKKVYAQLKKV